jgi:hypothetical protein
MGGVDLAEAFAKEGDSDERLGGIDDSVSKFSLSKSYPNCKAKSHCFWMI